MKAYDKTVPDDARVDTILGWLDLPVQSRPSFLTLYMEDVDTAGHDSGPDSAGSTRRCAMSMPRSAV